MLGWGCRGSVQQGREPEKLRGDFSCERSPLLAEFSKTWFGAQVTTIVTPKLFGVCGFGPAFPVLRCEIRCKSFLVPPVAARLPGVLRESHLRFPCESRFRFPCGAHLRCSSEFRCRFPSKPRFDSHPEFLSRRPCGLRFRFSWSSFPGSLASSVTGSPMALVFSLLLEDFSSVDS